jgi:hypothetical protein
LLPPNFNLSPAHESFLSEKGNPNSDITFSLPNHANHKTVCIDCINSDDWKTANLVPKRIPPAQFTQFITAKCVRNGFTIQITQLDGHLVLSFPETVFRPEKYCEWPRAS